MRVRWRQAMRAVVLAAILLMPSDFRPTGALADAPQAFIVDTTLDEVDAVPGDGQCTSTPSERCTLRAAIMETNAHPGPDTVRVPPGHYALAITGEDDTSAGGDFDITGDLMLVGEGPTRTFIHGGSPGGDGLNPERAVDILAGATVTITGVTIQDGIALGVNVGGAIRNRGTLTLQQSILRHNRASALANYLTATLIDVTVSENSYFKGAGAGIFNRGGLSLTRVTLSDNSRDDSNISGSGGGIYNSGTLTAQDVTFQHNGATVGGGFYNDGVAALERATFVNNWTRINSNTRGGGMYNGGTVVLTNATFHGNVVSTTGAAIWNWATAELTNVTVADNQAGTDDGRPGASIDNRGTLKVRSSVVQSVSGPACAGALESLGGNVENTSTCGFAGPTDRQNVAPVLGPLADNGGYTQTRALLPGSPAIDFANAATCPATDQRGRPRPLDGNGDGVPRCDAGAYERDVPGPEVGVRVAPDGPGRLRVTIQARQVEGRPINLVRELRFGATTNAVLDIGDRQGLTGPVTVPVAPPAPEITFVIRRESGGASATVPLVVTDSWGEWRTFVGGGPNAWGGSPAGPSAGPAGSPVPAPASPRAPTPTSTPPPSTAGPVACAPRPPVILNTDAAGSGLLHVRLTAGRGGIRQVELGRVVNAAVDLAGQTGLSAGARVPLAASPPEVTLLVRRLQSGPFIVPLTVTDGCGPWQTVVGGGANVP